MVRCCRQCHGYLSREYEESGAPNILKIFKNLVQKYRVVIHSHQAFKQIRVRQKRASFECVKKIFNFGIWIFIEDSRQNLKPIIIAPALQN